MLTDCYLNCFQDNDTGIAHCRIKNVPFGNYTAWILFLSDPIRCRSSTVWGGKNDICEWSVDISKYINLSLYFPRNLVACKQRSW